MFTKQNFSQYKREDVCKTGSVFGFEVFQGQKYKCSTPQVACQENMTNQQQGLKKHSKPVHEGLTYRCTESDYQTKRQEPLRKHMKDHHIRNPCPCDQCTYTTTLQERFNEHKKVHDEDSEINFICNPCEFNYEPSIRTHKETIHERPICYCDKCASQFVRQYDLRKHKTTVNGGTFHFSRDQCGEQLSKSSCLRSHNLSVHGGLNFKSYENERCFKTFSKPSKLKCQSLVWSGYKGKPHKWPVCRRSYGSHYNLKYRMENYSGDHETIPHQCNISPKPYPSNYPNLVSRFVGNGHLARSRHMYYFHLQ